LAKKNSDAPVYDDGGGDAEKAHELLRRSRSLFDDFIG
jgi:hypothetical protein